jgi:NAD(P)-dependent dehydrogenase (short-subunit alcohol dehydrogenase family)
MAILITGASGGLGTAVVEAFLATGATVYGTARAWKNQPHSNPRFHPIEANLLQPSECDRAAKLAAPVDALLHLVGGFDGGKPVAETPDETWDKILDLNLRSAQMMFRAVLPSMIKAGRGCIVAVGSRAAVEPMANFAAYSVSKAALVTLVKTVALEVKDSGITANVVLPSVIDTPANRAAMPSADASKWVTPESIAGLLVWLASDAARDVNGAVIPIYGRA